MAATAEETHLRGMIRAGSNSKRKFEARGNGSSKPNKVRGDRSRERLQSSNKMSKPQNAQGKKKPRRKQEEEPDSSEDAEDFHDDDDDEEEDEVEEGKEEEEESDSSEEGDGEEEEDGYEGGSRGDEESDDDGVEKEGATKFTNGCRAFKMAFRKIMSKNVPADSLLGPILCAHKKLVAEKLAAEVEEEQKLKGEAKKEKHMAGEKGHVKPASLVDSKEKFLISVATKGVVKLFNAVNKAQNPQKGLNPSRSKDAKVLAKRRREAFLSEIRKSTASNDNHTLFNHTKIPRSTDEEIIDEPGWAPLRDSYMLTNSKLKDWDKMADHSPSVEPDTMLSESSDEE